MKFFSLLKKVVQTLMRCVIQWGLSLNHNQAEPKAKEILSLYFLDLNLDQITSIIDLLFD